MSDATPAPRVVVQGNRRREIVITIAIVIALIGALIWGVGQLREKPQGNSLKGKIVDKVFTPMKEEIVEFNGRRLKSTRESDGEYVLKVRVDSEGGRIFEVPVTKSTYLLKKQGDSLTFIRPPSEQK